MNVTSNVTLEIVEKLVEFTEGKVQTPYVYVIPGLALLIVALGCICYCEKDLLGKEVKDTIAMQEAETVSNREVNPEHQGKLVYMSGTVEVSEKLTDPLVHVTTANSLHLRRYVEMLQWEEHKIEKHSHREKYGDSDQELLQTLTRTDYRYEKTWSTHVLSSTLFDITKRNPSSMMVPAEDFAVPPEQAKFGAFHLSASLIEQIKDSGAEDLQIGAWSQPADWPYGKTERRDKYIYILPPNHDGFMQAIDGIRSIVDGYYGDDRDYPVGTIRISFTYTPAGEFTLCSQQQNNTFAKHNFIRDGSNIRSRALAAKMDERRSMCLCFQSCLLDQSLLENDFEIIKRGTIAQKEEFFESELSTSCCNWCQRLTFFSMAWVGLLLLLYYAYTVAAPAWGAYGARYVVDSLLLALAIIFLLKALQVFVVYPARTCIFFSFALVFLAGLAIESYILSTKAKKAA
jgi:hypothetical protein